METNYSQDGSMSNDLIQETKNGNSFKNGEKSEFLLKKNSNFTTIVESSTNDSIYIDKNGKANVMKISKFQNATKVHSKKECNMTSNSEAIGDSFNQNNIESSKEFLKEKRFKSESSVTM